MIIRPQDRVILPQEELENKIAGFIFQVQGIEDLAALWENVSKDLGNIYRSYNFSDDELRVIDERLLNCFNYPGYIFEDHPITKSCGGRCSSARDREIKSANRIFIAGVSVGAILGLASGGIAALGTIAVAALVRDEGVRNAWANYEDCMVDC